MVQKPPPDDFIKLLSSLADPELMERFLRDLLTPQELGELNQRWQIAKLLHAGRTQREIARELGVSIGTVSRGARQMKYGNDGFQDLLSRLKTPDPNS